MRHELLTQRALFVLESMQKRSRPNQHFMTHVVPLLNKMQIEDSQNGMSSLLTRQPHNRADWNTPHRS